MADEDGQMDVAAAGAEPPEALVRSLAEWLYSIAPKPPGPPDPPLYSPVRNGPLWRSERRRFEATARDLLSQKQENK